MATCRTMALHFQASFAPCDSDGSMAETAGVMGLLLLKVGFGFAVSQSVIVP